MKHLLLVVGTLGCGGTSAPKSSAVDAASAIDSVIGVIDAPRGVQGRDWITHPAVYLAPGGSMLWAVSDVHGDRDRLIALLAGAGLTGGTAAAPTWLAGTDTLVVNGDSIDKGPQSIEVLDYWIALVPVAAAAGGRVVVLLGNHEVEFLADPTNSKAAALDAELAAGETPAMFADRSDPHGRFMRDLPIAAIVGGWFFSHAGNSQGLAATEIAAKFRTAIDADAWGDPFLVDPNSILEARNWWPASGTKAFLDGYLAALPAKHIVFGHSPPTFGTPTGNLEMHSEGRLTLIDVGMSSAVNDSTGKLLRVTQPGTAVEAAAMVDPSGTVTALDMTR